MSHGRATLRRPQGRYAPPLIRWGFAGAASFAVGLLAACGAAPTALDPDAGVDAGVLADAGAVDAGPVEGPRWSTVAPMREARQETAVVAYQGEVVVLGGYDADQVFGRRVEAYDPATNAWRGLPSVPVRMHHANVAVVGDALWVVGFLSDGFEEDGRIYRYDPGADAWSAQGEMPANRARGASVVAVHQGLIYLVGGMRFGGAVGLVDRFDPASGAWQALPPIPRGVDHGVGGVIGDRLYVAGGRGGLIQNHRPDLDVLDLTAGTWSAGPPMPTSRGGAAGAVLDGRLYVMGGEGNRGGALFSEVEAFDPVTGRWSSLPPLVPARHGMGAAAVGGRIFLPGGANVEAFGAVAVHQVLDP